MHKGVLAKIEKILASLVALLLAYLVVRTYILSQWDFGYIRGPLAPREYYELGLINEPIPSEEYLPYTLEDADLRPATGEAGLETTPEVKENTQESALQVENVTE